MKTLDQPLAGRTSVVTGASAGIGESCARELASLGAAVVVNARRKERLDALVKAIEADGGRAAAVAGDCAEQSVIDGMLNVANTLSPLPSGEGRGEGARPTHRSESGATCQGVDLVVVNAGRGLAGSVMTSDTAQWDEMIRTNLTAAAMLVRSAAERMLQRGESLTDRARDIIILGSNVGKHVSPFSSMYGSTKFGVGAIAEGARRELGPKGIRVSLVCPGIVSTEFQAVAGYTDELQQGFKEKFAPLLEANDVARTIAFIASQPAHVHINDVVIRPTRQDYP